MDSQPTSSSRSIPRRHFLGLMGGLAGALTACSHATTPTGGNETFWAGRPMVLNKDPLVIRKVKELFDFEIKPLSVAWGDYLTRLQSLIVGGDIPDVMWIADPDQVQKFADQGAIGEVPRDLISSAAPTLSAAIDKTWSQGWAYGFVDGANYGIPTYYNGRWSNASLWRSDLLEAAGVDGVPTDLDSAEAAFKALKSKGVVGLTSAGASYFAAFHTIFGAFGVMPTAWQMIDGRLVNGAVADGAADALRLLNSWYRAGYLDPEFSTKESGAQNTKFVTGAVAFYDYGGFNATDKNDPGSNISLARSTNPKASIEISRPLEGPAGRAAWAWGTAGNTLSFSADFVKDQGRLRAALAALEGVYASKENSLLFALGEEGTQFEYEDSSAGIEGGFHYIGKYTDTAARDAEGIGAFPYFGIPQWQISDTVAVPNSTIRKQQTELGSDTIVDLFGKATAVPGAAAHWSNLTNLKVTAYTEFINGSRSLSDWDAFVAEWNTNGGDELQQAAEKFAEQLH